MMYRLYFLLIGIRIRLDFRKQDLKLESKNCCACVLQLSLK